MTEQTEGNCESLVTFPGIFHLSNPFSSETVELLENGHTSLKNPLKYRARPGMMASGQAIGKNISLIDPEMKGDEAACSRSPCLVFVGISINLH